MVKKVHDENIPLRAKEVVKKSLKNEIIEKEKGKIILKFNPKFL